MKFDLNDYLSTRRAQVEAALAQIVAPSNTVPESLRLAVAYSLLAGGKRLRPILALAGCEAVGGSPEQAMPVGCAVEMIHTYSLIHDDLPSMDDDDFRRGRPTSHKVHGEAMAILAGDALLSDAFLILTQAEAPPKVLVAVLREVAEAAGSGGLVGGQVVDVESTGKPVDMAVLTRLHRMKTGALLRCAVRTGAMLGGGSDDAVARLTAYGEALGLAFQIIDDVLDVTADLQTLGKDPGSDREAGKTTFVDLLGVDGARRRAGEVMGEGIAALLPLGAQAEPLRALARYTIERDR